MHCETTDFTDPEMDDMETLSTAMRRFAEAGYGGQFTARDESVECGTCGSRWDPETLVVAEVFRHEGMSDPDDESVLLALKAPCGHRGTLVAAYGPDTPASEAGVLRRLPVHPR